MRDEVKTWRREVARWQRETLSRRAFLRGAAGGAAVLFVGTACGGEDGGPTPDAMAGAPDAPAPIPDADPLAPDADLTPQCEETVDDVLGPFWKDGAPERNDLTIPGDPGVRFTVSGTVFRRDQDTYMPTCTPLPGALLDIWQCNDAAVYDQAGWNYRGRIYTDAAGGYTLHTIIPGHYLNGAQYRPAHIHVRASSPTTSLLTTQLYFEGDPYNDIDPFIDVKLIMPLTDDGMGGKLSTFDFVLRSA